MPCGAVSSSYQQPVTRYSPPAFPRRNYKQKPKGADPIGLRLFHAREATDERSYGK